VCSQGHNNLRLHGGPLVILPTVGDTLALLYRGRRGIVGRLSSPSFTDQYRGLVKTGMKTGAWSPELAMDILRDLDTDRGLTLNHLKRIWRWCSGRSASDRRVETRLRTIAKLNNRLICRCVTDDYKETYYPSTWDRVANWRLDGYCQKCDCLTWRYEGD